MPDTKTITVRLPLDLYERVEKARTGMPREKWVRLVIERALDTTADVAPPRRTVKKRDDVSLCGCPPGSCRGLPGKLCAFKKGVQAPVRAPSRVRTSAQARAGVKPNPKH